MRRTQRVFPFKELMKELKVADCIANIRKYARLIEAELVDIEGNQRNAESGTTACSAAGCCVTPENSLRSAAGNPDGGSLEAFEKWLMNEWESMRYDQIENGWDHSRRLIDVTVARDLLIEYQRQGAA